MSTRPGTGSSNPAEVLYHLGKARNPVAFSGNFSGSPGTSTLYTCPAGKIAFIHCSITASVNNNATTIAATTSSQDIINGIYSSSDPTTLNATGFTNIVNPASLLSPSFFQPYSPVSSKTFILYSGQSVILIGPGFGITAATWHGVELDLAN